MLKKFGKYSILMEVTYFDKGFYRSEPVEKPVENVNNFLNMY